MRISRSLLLALVVALPTAAQAALPSYMYVNNNEWGWSHVQSGSWQSAWNWSQGQGWGSNWDITPNDGNPSYSVKGFPCAVIGWNWSSINTASGLPLQFSSGKHIYTNISQTIKYTGTSNGHVIAGDMIWDCWGDSSSNPGNRNVGMETMIWTYQWRSYGPSKSGSTFRDNRSGNYWAMSNGTAGTWQVYNYNLTWNTTNVAIDIQEFQKNIVSRGLKPSNWYTVGVHQGYETVAGNGQVDSGLGWSVQ